MGYIAHIPLNEGRFLEAILKAERDVASPPRPVNRAREVRTHAKDSEATPEVMRGAGPKIVTVERREAPSRLRGTAHASQTWRRAITRATG